MKAGELIGQGTLFLRSGVYSARTSAGDMQVILPMLERRGSGVQNITCIWSGTAAESFLHLHGASLKAGTALELTFSKFWCMNNELHATVHTATLAPARWEYQKHQAANANQAEQREVA